MQNREIRLANLRHLIKREGAVSQLALRLQISPIYIYRVLDGKFNIGDSMARKIEDSYGYTSSWMDADHGHDEDFLPDVPTLISPESEGFQVGEGARPSSFGVEATPASTTSVPTNSMGAGSPAGEASSRTRVDVYEHLIVSLTNTVDRMLDAHGVELSANDKAKLVMQVAQRILDNSRTGTAQQAQQISAASPIQPRPVLKISER
jgi:hypothetical protein